MDQSWMVGWVYIDINGQTYARNATRYIVEQKDESGRYLVGGRPLTIKDDGYRPSGGLKPRTVTVINPKDGNRRQVVVFSEDAPLWTGSAAMIQLLEGGELHTYQVRAKNEERMAGRKRRRKTPEPAKLPGPGPSLDSTIELMFWNAWKSTTRIALTPQHPVLRSR